jgi:hypothetical protein
MLSGYVVATGTDGRRPMEAWVVYYARCDGGEDAYMWTEADGHYEFCRLPQGPGCLVVGDFAHEAALKQIPVEIHGDTRLDVELSDADRNP